MKDHINIIMLGDVIGEAGIAALEKCLPQLIQQYGASLVVANGENASGGFGMTAEVFDRLLAAGVDLVTSGNHIWQKRDFWPVMDSDLRILRPANYPSDCPGRGYAKTEKAGLPLILVNLQGRISMAPIDCPFKTMDRLLESSDFCMEPRPVIIVDFHAESTEEKEALAFYLDGRVNLIAGTHTHVQTADERLLPKGSAYITDLGMTGAEESIIGMDIKLCLDRSRTQIPYRMECAIGNGTLQGIIAGIDNSSGKTLSIERLCVSA